MDRAELVGNLSEDILTYVMHGAFPEHHVAREIKPTGLDERFNDYEKLVDLHFVLRPSVVEFAERLPDRLRSVKTQTKDVSEVNRGGMSGRINWSATIQERYSTNPYDRSLFVCDNRSEDYDVDENVVLKRLLSLVYTTLEDCEQYLRFDYDWVTDRWKEGLDLIEQTKRIFERNVHVTRIRDPSEYEPTERMLQRAEASRSELYREAAELLRFHRRSREGDEDAIRDLLDETAITPDDDETLLELFVLFRFVATIEGMRDDEFELRTIETDSQEVARIGSDEDEIVLYHDNSARDRKLSFITEATEKPDEDLTRTERVQRESRRVADRYFGEAFSRRTGRPDVIVLELQQDGGHEYLITEVKNSTRPETIRSGIKETLEYLAFLRRDEEYVYEADNAFGTGWNGVLVIQDVEDDETASLHEQQSIRILQASQVEEQLERVLQQVMN